MSTKTLEELQRRHLELEIENLELQQEIMKNQLDPNRMRRRFHAELRESGYEYRYEDGVWMINSIRLGTTTMQRAGLMDADLYRRLWQAWLTGQNMGDLNPYKDSKSWTLNFAP